MKLVEKESRPRIMQLQSATAILNKINFIPNPGTVAHHAHLDKNSWLIHTGAKPSRFWATFASTISAVVELLSWQFTPHQFPGLVALIISYCMAENH